MLTVLKNRLLSPGGEGPKLQIAQFEPPKTFFDKLSEAISKGDRRQFKYLIKTFGENSQSLPDGEITRSTALEPLILAAKNGQEDFVDTLLNLSYKIQFHLLLAAVVRASAEGGHFKLTEKILRNKVYGHCSDEETATILSLLTRVLYKMDATKLTQTQIKDLEGVFKETARYHTFAPFFYALSLKFLNKDRADEIFADLNKKDILERLLSVARNTPPDLGLSLFEQSDDALKMLDQLFADNLDLLGIDGFHLLDFDERAKKVNALATLFLLIKKVPDSRAKKELLKKAKTIDAKDLQSLLVAASDSGDFSTAETLFLTVLNSESTIQTNAKLYQGERSTLLVDILSMALVTGNREVFQQMLKKYY
ncbi:MAG: hypothetical protein D6780_03855, partial [Candidatus Dadabacteria bacterium]